MEEERSFSQEPNSNTAPEKKSKAPIYLGASILLLLAVIFFVWRTFQLENERERQEKVIADTYLQLDSISDELDQRIITIQELGGQVDTLVALREQLENDKKNLLTRSENQQKQIARLNNRVDGYRELLLIKDEEIKQLKELTDQLTEENTTLKVEKNQLNQSIQELQQNKQELADKVAVASQLEIDGLSVYAVNDRGKERKDEFRNRHINQLKIQFTVLDNEIAPIEGKELLLRVVAPDGNVLFDVTRGSGSFTFDGRELFYTARQEILYDKKSQLVTYLYDKGSEYAIGQHQVEVYTDDYLMGKGSFMVK